MSKISGIEEKYTNTGEYVICYFDLLGTKELLKKNKEEAFADLWLVNHCIKKYLNNRKDAIIRTFSDNYFVALEVKDDINKDFEDLVNIVGNVCAEVLTGVDMPLRGYITKGEMHIDEDTIIGLPLVRAYQYESKIVKYPRICIDINLIGIKDNDINNLKNAIFIDSDLMPCINILKFIDQKFLQVFENKISYFLIEDIEKDSDEVLSKKLWLMNYINSYYLCNFGYKIVDISKLNIYNNK